MVDDGSRDGTPRYLADSWPEVRVVVQENAGVTAAMNRCFIEARGEYIALLNNDLDLAPGFLELLASELDQHPEAGSACPKMLDFHDRGLLDGAGDAMRWSGACWRRGHAQRDRGQYDRHEPVISACGGAAMYRRCAVEKVGPFDPDFVAYLETWIGEYARSCVGGPASTCPGRTASTWARPPPTGLRSTPRTRCCFGETA